MNVVFGSGIVGLLAKLILGPKWKIIPFHRSRFFSWNPALDDNFIIHDEEILPFIKEITSTIGRPVTYQYNRAWSVGGILIHQFNEDICRDWLHKIFGNNPPPQAHLYMRNRINMQVYDIRANQLYFDLMNQYLPEIKSEAEKGTVTEIGAHYFIRNGVREDFDKAVSTIPLDALLKLMKNNIDLPSKTTHYIHIETEDLDFEGANQILIADSMFDFYKATNIAPKRYLLYFQNDVVNYGLYLMNFIKKFEILDGTSIEKAIPIGQAPNMTNIEENAGIYCVGSYAQWDWCADVGSNILRLLRYNNRGNEAQKPQSIKI